MAAKQVVADDLLKQLEAQEREAFKAFEEKQKEARMKALGSVIEPLVKERNKKAQQVNDLNTELNQLDKEIAKLKGLPMRPGKVKASRGTGSRLTKAEKLQLQEQALSYIGKNAKGVSRGSVAEHLGIDPSQAATIIRGLFGDKKIKKQGDKASTVWLTT